MITKTNLTHLDLFAGIGGFSLAASRHSILTTDCVEINPFCQKVLKKNFFHARIHPDITTYRGQFGSHDIITFGSPCQDFSIAGKQKGITGDRSILFYEATRIISEVRPLGFIMENVPNVTKWFEYILPALSQSGLYELRWFSLRVDQLGGSHRRERVFILGKLTHSYGGSCQIPRNQKRKKRTDSTHKHSSASANQSRSEAEPRVCSEDDGVSEGLARCIEFEPINYNEGLDQLDRSDRNEKLHALGNAVTPQQAYIAFEILLNWLS